MASEPTVPHPSEGIIRPHAAGLSLLHRVVDIVIVLASLAAAGWLFDAELHGHYWMAATWAVILFFVVSEMNGLYRSWRLSSLSREVFRLMSSWAITALALIAMAFLTNVSGSYSRLVVVTWFLLAPALLLGSRVVLRTLLRQLRKRGRNTRTLAIAGSGRLAAQIAAKAASADWLGLQLIGFFDDDNRRQDAAPDTVRGTIKGNFADLVGQCRNGSIDYVYVAISIQDEKVILRLLHDLADTTASVYLVPDLFVVDLLQSRWVDIDGTPLVSVFESPFYGVNGWLKRLEDLLLATVILGVMALPMLAIAAAIRISSPGGPVIFRQRRYGLNGTVVEVWKFRTMNVLEDSGNIEQARKNDPRITAMGGFLRRTSLDELPQFFNVLQGHMSIVGPRPHAIAHNEQYRGLIHGYMLRHKVKPGITGWAQVNGWRGETDTLEKMRKRVEFDLEYVRNWSLWLDMRIVLLTMLRGFTGHHAY